MRATKYINLTSEESNNKPETLLPTKKALQQKEKERNNMAD